MSQWNNSYVYNNQYQGTNNWNGDMNGQYMNQGYYTRPEGAQQYVSFNEFLNQVMPGNAVAGNTANYNNVQYESYPPQQYRYQNMASTSQPPAGSYNYQSVPANMSSEVSSYQQSAPSQYNPQSEQAFAASNDVILNSNLTATATEFVPKSVSQPSTSTQNIPEATNTQNVANEAQSNYLKKPKGSSSDKNWRERPKSSQTSEKKEKPAVNGYPNENGKGYSNNTRNRDTYRNNEGNGRHYENRNQDVSNRDIESAGQSQESNYDNESYSQSESTNQESSRKNYNSRNRNYDNSRNCEPSSHSHDSNNKNQDSSNKTQENQSRNFDGNSRNSRNYESNRNQESSRNQDTNARFESNNRNDRKNQPKNSKFKGKESDNRTFYNSSMPKEQDTRGGRGEGSRGRNWGGSQRLRGADRNNVEDEQYASNYTPQREERYERENKERERYDKDNKDRDRYDRDNKERDRYDRDNKDRDRYERDNKEKDRYDRDNKDKDRYDRDNKEKDRYDRDRERYDRERDRPERAPRVQNSSTASPRFRGKQGDQVNKEMTQRERLAEQLDKGTLECLVCCDRVKQMDPVWWCTNCYHVMHLRCIRKWAISSMVEGKWRCPACQNCSDSIPTEYRCMCGAVRSPEYNRGAGGAHTCGRSCRRARACPHPCTLLCHPGPCPPCQATVTRQCGCGAETRSILCSSKLAQVCGRVCGRGLECEEHTCTRECHEGACDACAETVQQVCHCPAAQERTVACTRGAGAAWSCGGACGRVLACGAHVCRAPCHAPPCEPCALRPEAVPACPCGKMKLAPGARQSCSDPIPLCGNICAKPLPCGPAGDKHFCKIDCHEGPCPACPEKTLVQCRCGHSSREVPCADLPDMLNNVLCQKKCNKKLSCGRHRCRATCCAGGAHRCAVPCGRSLACGAHRCEDFCHTGHCAPCPRVSFSELTCECGAQVLHPPVRCGTRPPACEAACRRARSCGHPPHHHCHSGDCPPCVVLTTKRCYGDHEERKTIPCSQEEFSCGLPCGKPLPCGKHTCIKTCHKGPCDTGKCTQPCMEKRPSCGHPCAAPCHSGSGTECPSAAACRRLVRASCPCGRRHAERTCSDNARDLAKMMSTLAATKMQESGTVDLSEVQRPSNMLKTLECDDECRVEARTRQMALALQIRNPDVSAKLAPRYNDTLRAAAARDPSFAQHVHDALTDLVQRAKNSKQKTRSHSFPSMNWQKRQFIHELSEHFGCESVAYDAEPNRNVVATAEREKSWLPAMSVLEVLAREAGKRKVPGPVLRAPPAAAATSANKSSGGGWATLTSSNAWAARSQAKQAAPAQPEPKIDYFDNPPDN